VFHRTFYLNKLVIRSWHILFNISVLMNITASLEQFIIAWVMDNQTFCGLGKNLKRYFSKLW
jgi:hypothetical protein